MLLVGDTAVADGDSLEQCLSRFTLAGPKLFVAGNHELWTQAGDSAQLRGLIPSVITIWSGKADYTQSLSKSLKLETGWKSSFPCAE